MPISTRIPIRRLSQDEFAELSYEVMRHVFDIHNELGRFFDESIYKIELAHRLPGTRLEEPIDVTFGTFHKQYFIDVLVGEGAIFEFKGTESLAPRHRAQLMHYLLLTGVAHGKLINVRPADIQHEFVNARWEPTDRRRFQVDAARWDSQVPGAAQLEQCVTALLQDLGAGLQIALYEEAVVHEFGGSNRIETDVCVDIDGRVTGRQKFRLIAPGVALKITGLHGGLESFELHARRLLAHIDVRTIAWVNVNLKHVTFTTLQK